MDYLTRLDLPENGIQTGLTEDMVLDFKNTNLSLCFLMGF
jgi:hypothetical protein